MTIARSILQRRSNGPGMSRARGYCRPKVERLEDRLLLSLTPVDEPSRSVAAAIDVAAAAAPSAEGALEVGDHVPGELLVKFKPGASRAARRDAAQALGAATLTSFAKLGIEHWQLGPSLPVQQAMATLSGPAYQGLVEYAEPNYVVGIHSITNDPLLSELWGMQNFGQNGGTVDADVDAPAAWQLQTGSPSVVVAVIDTGIFYTHEDLAENIWINPGEIAGNGIDDDDNGFVDDVGGWDFVNNDNDPLDDNGHGTHVAGTIGAIGNNGVGVAGVNWNVSLIPLKILSANGNGTRVDSMKAIEYAASLVNASGEQMVSVINASYGGGVPSNAEKDAIAAFDGLFVAAAGNSGRNSKEYPAGYNLGNMVAAAATDPGDNLADFSNRGKTWVHLGAPGVGILSTTPAGYGREDGTSMAAPHVAGAAALLLAQNPGWTAAQVKDQILATVDPIASLADTTVSGGRLNVRAALEASPLPADAVPPDAVSDLAADPPTNYAVHVSWSTTGDDGPTGPAYLNEVRYLPGVPLTETNWESAITVQGEPVPGAAGSPARYRISGLSPSTTYFIGVKVADEVGNFSALSNVISITTEATRFVIDVVDSAASVDNVHDLAFAPDGTPSIAYHDQGVGSVNYADGDGSSWNIEAVDSGLDVDSAIGLAFDPVDGNPSVAYGTLALHFAHFDGAAWNIEVIDAGDGTDDRNEGIPLVYDATDNPTVTYRSVTQTGGELKYARRDGGAWQSEVVDSTVAARYRSMAYDPAGDAAIAYSDNLDGDNWLDALKFAKWNALTSTWDIEVVDSGRRGIGVFASLAYDPTTGNPAIAALIGGIGGDVMNFYAWDGAQWTVETVDASARFDGISLAYDSSGMPYITYIDRAPEPDLVKLAYRSGNKWQIELVDGDRSASWWTSLDLNAAGRPTLSYRDNVNGDLLFAQIGDAAPSVAIVEPGDGATVAGTVTVQIDAGDTEDPAGTLTVEWSLDGGAWQSAAYNLGTGYYEASWDTTTAGEGSHTIDARATDSGANTTSVGNALSVDNVDDAPSANVVNPAAGATVSGVVTIQVDASDDRDAAGTLVVEISIDGGTYQATTYNIVAGFYEWSWDTTLETDGPHTIDARATDSVAQTTNATQIGVTVDNSLPATITVTDVTPNSMAAGDTVSVTIAGTGFVTGAAVSFENFAGPNPAVSNVVVVDSNTITADVNVPTNGPNKDRVGDVRVTNPDSSTDACADCFTVTVGGSSGASMNVQTTASTSDTEEALATVGDRSDPGNSITLLLAGVSKPPARPTQTLGSNTQDAELVDLVFSEPGGLDDSLLSELATTLEG